LGRSREHGPEVRIIAAPSEQADTTKASGSSKAPRAIVDSKIESAESELHVRSSVRDLTFGDSAKAMVDEVIWNMEPGDYEVYLAALQQGKTPEEAARAAGGQLAVIHRKISEYTAKLQGVLSRSKATINIEEIVDKPLEQAMIQIISDGAISEPEKDALIQQLGIIQESVKDGLQGDVALSQANRIMLAIGELLNWGGTTKIPEDIKPVYRTLYNGLKTAIRNAAPEAQNLHDRLTNLHAAKSDLDDTISTLKAVPQVAAKAHSERTF